jgi:hypothetical protein
MGLGEGTCNSILLRVVEGETAGDRRGLRQILQGKVVNLLNCAWLKSRAKWILDFTRFF